MLRKHYKTEQTVALLGRVEMLVSNRRPISEACREAGIGASGRHAVPTPLQLPMERSRPVADRGSFAMSAMGEAVLLDG